jgi:hypothetical protein
LAAGFSAAVGPITVNIGGNNFFAGLAVSATVGGVAAELGGGKFENGAKTAAFSYMFNAMGNSKDRGYQDLSYNTVAGPQFVEGGRGGWLIQWQLSIPSIDVGYIIQDMIISDSDGGSVHYWEAWRVDPGSTVTTFAAAGFRWDDGYTYSGSLPGSSGSIIWNGSARFYEGLNLPSTFVPGGAGKPPGMLPATTIDPELPTSTWRATSPVKRTLNDTW